MLSIPNTPKKLFLSKAYLYFLKSFESNLKENLKILENQNKS
jgi:hypothetical protein